MYSSGTFVIIAFAEHQPSEWRRASSSHIRHGTIPYSGSWLVREHGDILQQMAVGIAKEDGRGRHPGENDRLICWSTVEVEGRDARGAQRARRSNHICEAGAERGVRCDSLGPEPAVHSPSIAFPAAPIQKNAA